MKFLRANALCFIFCSGCAVASRFSTSRPVRHLASVARQRSYPREMEYLFMLEQAAFRNFFNIFVFEFLSAKLVLLFEGLYRIQFL
ncbi:hypothetical protein Ahy_A03g016116 isoform B [Arachis hypogaea]|uniref:Secreted protein n=1 Tax=Arachis hypogaea TaxID=3818 RepID=A0A445E2B2_ARAHY|nr:hypothetical protein Ahy_A03g016116 isoform B [Arachis hypogaea]